MAESRVEVRIEGRVEGWIEGRIEADGLGVGTRLRRVRRPEAVESSQAGWDPRSIGERTRRSRVPTVRPIFHLKSYINHITPFYAKS
jgi:hypothetical protein